MVADTSIGVARPLLTSTTTAGSPLPNATTAVPAGSTTTPSPGPIVFKEAPAPVDISPLPSYSSPSTTVNTRVASNTTVPVAPPNTTTGVSGLGGQDNAKTLASNNNPYLTIPKDPRFNNTPGPTIGIKDIISVPPRSTTPVIREAPPPPTTVTFGPANPILESLVDLFKKYLENSPPVDPRGRGNPLGVLLERILREKRENPYFESLR